MLDWATGAPAIISSVGDRDPAALRELERLKLLPGVDVVIDRKNAHTSLLIRDGGDKEQTRVSNELASHVSVVARS